MNSYIVNDLIFTHTLFFTSNFREASALKAAKIFGDFRAQSFLPGDLYLCTSAVFLFRAGEANSLPFM